MVKGRHKGERKKMEEKTSKIKMEGRNKSLCNTVQKRMRSSYIVLC